MPPITASQQSRRESSTSPAAKLDSSDVPHGQLPVGFLARATSRRPGRSRSLFGVSKIIGIRYYSRGDRVQSLNAFSRLVETAHMSQLGSKKRYPNGISGF
jgi:hypothetical protein